MLAPAGALLLVAAAVVRRHRLLAWPAVLTLTVALLVYVSHVSVMAGNLTV